MNEYAQKRLKEAKRYNEAKAERLAYKQYRKDHPIGEVALPDDPEERAKVTRQMGIDFTKQKVREAKAQSKTSALISRDSAVRKAYGARSLEDKGKFLTPNDVVINPVKNTRNNADIKIQKTIDDINAITAERDKYTLAGGTDSKKFGYYENLIKDKKKTLKELYSTKKDSTIEKAIAEYNKNHPGFRMATPKEELDLRAKAVQMQTEKDYQNQMKARDEESWKQHLIMMGVEPGTRVIDMNEDEWNKYHQAQEARLNSETDEYKAFKTSEKVIKDVDKYASKYYNDTGAIDQAKANYGAGRIGQDTNKVFYNYMEHQSNSNKELASIMSQLQNDYTTINEAAMSNDDEVLNGATKAFRQHFAMSLASYLPQAIDQGKAMAVGAGAGLIVSLATAGIINPISAMKAGASIASGMQSYELMSGAAFKTLVESGVDISKARMAAVDEGIVSGLIESLDTYMDLMLFGKGGELKDTVLKKFTGSLSKKLGFEVTENLAYKLIAGAMKLAVNAAQEYGEEYTQEAVSIANEKRIDNDTTDKGLFNLVKGAFDVTKGAMFGNTDEDKENRERMTQAGEEGFRIGLMMGGANMTGSVAANEALNIANDTLNNYAVGRKYIDDARAVIDEGLAMNDDTTAKNTAKKLQQQMDNKGKVSKIALGELVAENEKRLNPNNLNGISSTLGENGSKAIISSYDKSVDTDIYAKEFVNVYNKILNGYTVEASETTNLTTEQLKAAVMSANQDAKMPVYNDRKKAYNGNIDYATNAQTELKSVVGDNIEVLENMKPVFNTSTVMTNSAQQTLKNALSNFKDETIVRDDIGEIQLDKAMINDSIEQLDTSIEAAMFSALPSIIENGTVIAETDNTITVAAPVKTLNRNNNMAVVLERQADGTYGIKNVLMPNGAEFTYEEVNNNGRGVHNGEESFRNVVYDQSERAGQVSGSTGELRYGGVRAETEKDIGRFKEEYDSNGRRKSRFDEVSRRNEERKRKEEAYPRGKEVSAKTYTQHAVNNQNVYSSTPSKITQALAKKNGVDVRAWVGGEIQLTNNEVIRGCQTGNSICVQGDNDLYSGFDLSCHEIMHYKIQTGAVDVDTVLSEASRYVDGTDILEAVKFYTNSFPNLTPMEAQEELICDGADHINQARDAYAYGLNTDHMLNMSELLDEVIPALNKVANELTNNAFVLEEGDMERYGGIDTEYLNAVSNNDMETAQRMVDEAAEKEFLNSKIRDDSGKLIKVYHGTTENFTVFDRTKSRINMDIQGNFFSPWEIDAKGYGSNVRAFYLNITNPANESTAYKALHMFTGENKAGAKARDYLISQGYDGVNGEDMEYIAFDSNQIKSADPVTYDDNGRVIPLSERFNTSENDIRYSSRINFDEVLKDNADLKQQLRKTTSQLKTKTKQAEYWKGQTKLTKEITLRESDIKKVSSELIKTYQSKIKTSDISARMKDLGEFILRGAKVDGEFSFETIREKATDIARDIVQNASVLSDNNDAVMYDELKSYLQNTVFYITRSDSNNIADFSSWKKSLPRGMKVRYGDESNVDVIYTEMASMYPWIFSTDTLSVSDQLRSVAEALYALEPIYENPYDADMANAIDFCANDVIKSVLSESVRQTAPTYADKADKKLKDYKAKSKEALKQVREKRDAKIKALKEHYADLMKSKTSRELESKQRQRLLNIAKRLQNKKLPAVNRELLNQYIGDLDTVAVNLTGQRLDRLIDLKIWYDDYLKNDDNLRDPYIEKQLDRLSKRHIGDMSIADVQSLTTVLLGIENTLRTEQNAIRSALKQDFFIAGIKATEDINSTNGHGKNVFSKAYHDKFIDNVLSPERFVHRMTGYVENDPLYILTKEVSAGQRAMQDYQMRAGKLFEKFVSDKKYIKAISGKNAELVTIKGLGDDGEIHEAKVTRAMVISLFLHGLNDDNMRHIRDGGISIPDMEIYKRNPAEAYDTVTKLRITPSELKKVVYNMPEADRKFAKAVYGYFNGVSKYAINTVSEQLKGYSLAGVENYFPIDVDKNFLNTNFDAMGIDGTIEGMGFLKERVVSSKPIYLRDVTSVLNKSIDMTAKYVGLAIPVRNFNRLWNTANTYENTTLKETVNKKWGKAAQSYIQNFMTQIQNPKHKESSLLTAVRGNYAKAALNFNAGVAAKQTASYPTAAAVLGYKPLAKAMGNWEKVDLDNVAKYTPLLWYRSQGYSTQELGDLKKPGKPLPKSLNWIKTMDIATTKKLWKASEYYVRDKYNDLEIGSDAYYKAVADVYNEVIENTQPNYTVMQRPQILRSDNEVTQMLVMFKTQPLQNFNILYDSIGNYVAKSRAAKVAGTAEAKAELKNARVKMVNALTSQFVSAVMFSVITAVFDILLHRGYKYKDEDDKYALAPILKQLGLSVLGSGAGMVPFGSETLSFAEATTDKILKVKDMDEIFGAYWDGLEVSPLEAISDALNSVQNIAVEIAKSTNNDFNKEKTARALYNDCEKLIVLFKGVPAATVRRYGVGIAQNIIEKVQPGCIGEYKALRIVYEPKDNSRKYYDLLYKAYKNNDDNYVELYNYIQEDQYKNGETQEDLDNRIKLNIEKRIKEELGVNSVKDLSKDQRFNKPGTAKKIVE